MKLIERVRFRGVRVMGVQDGFDSLASSSRMQAGLSGIIGEEFRATIRDRTYSALQMRAKQGSVTGGRAYGYDNQRRISEPAASIVREIFARHAAGESMRAIACDLNARGVPSPGSTWKRSRRRVDGRWLVSALHAMLHNELYIGQVIWNRSEWIKDPDSGKRIRRERPRPEWIAHHAPELALVDQQTWEEVQRRLNANAQAPRETGSCRGGRRRYLLSGLLDCGLCGAKLIIVGTAPRHMYVCGTYHAGGPSACRNRVTARRDVAEDLLLRPVRQDLLGPEAVEYAVEVIRDLWRQNSSRPAVEISASLADLDREILELERLIKTHVLSAAIGGVALEKARSTREQKMRSVQRLFRAEAAYRANVASLASVLSGSNVDLAREALRPLLGTIRCTPDESDDHLIAEFGLDRRHCSSAPSVLT